MAESRDALPDQWTRLGMNTPEDVVETVLRCARAVQQADADHTVEDFDVIGVVADMVEVYARENDRMRRALETIAYSTEHPYGPKHEDYATVAQKALSGAGQSDEKGQTS